MIPTGGHRLQLDYLITFCAVIEEGGFSAAARHLHLSQPAVSHQVSALEQELGCRLIDRTRKPPTLTEPGSRVYPHIERCVRSFRRVETITREMRRGGFRLSTVYTVGERLLPQVLSAFRQAHAGVSVTVMVSDRLHVLQSVLNGGTDLGISFTLADDPAPPTTLSVLPLRDEPLRLVVSRSHAWATAAGLDLDDLRHGELILRDPRLATRRLVETSLDVSRLNVLMEVGTNEALRAAVKAGLGAAFMYESALDDDLVAVPLHGLSAGRRLVALVPRDSACRQWVHTFLDLLPSPQAR